MELAEFASDMGLMGYQFYVEEIMLRISKLADYGIVISVTMARDPHSVHSAANLAISTGLPMETVRKSLKMLARGGVVASQRGVNGGYLLSSRPEDISLGMLISSADGPLEVSECSSVTARCDQRNTCGARANWQKVNSLISDVLQHVSLADMASPRTSVPVMRPQWSPKFVRGDAGPDHIDLMEKRNG